MRLAADSLTGRVLAVVSRRSPGFRPPTESFRRVEDRVPTVIQPAPSASGGSDAPERPPTDTNRAAAPPGAAARQRRPSLGRRLLTSIQANRPRSLKQSEASVQKTAAKEAKAGHTDPGSRLAPPPRTPSSPPQQQDGPGPGARATFGAAQQGTAHGLLLAIAVQGFGGANSALKRHLREAMTRLVYEAAAAAELRPEGWRTQEGGDSLLALLPPDTPAPTLVDTFMRHLHAGLRPFNRERVRQAALRLRVAVHQGLVSIDAHGFVGQAVDTAVRIADSAALRTALAEAPDADLAVGVSDAIFGDVVRGLATGIRPDEFRQVLLEQKQYRGKAWIWVPGSSPQAPETRPGDAVDAVTSKGSRIVSDDFTIRAGPVHGSRGVDAFTAGLLQRIRATEADLLRARQEGDDFLIEVEEAELADLRRLAAERGVEVGDRWSGSNE